MVDRRAFIFGLGATLSVIRTPGLLMPIRPVIESNTSIWLIKWGPMIETDGFDIFTDPVENRFNAHTSFAKSWPPRTIKAPPGGFKIERA